jgi:hypothetical protein
MASDVGGYMSSGGTAETGQSERRSFDEGTRKNVGPVVKKLAKLSLKDKDSTPSAPVSLRLEPWGHIPDPPQERHEFIKKLLGDQEGRPRRPRFLGGEGHHNSRAPSPAPSPLSRSTSLSRTLSTIRGDKNPVPKTSLAECFKRFTSVEVLDGDNKFACEECAKVPHSKRPRYLIS